MMNDWKQSLKGVLAGAAIGTALGVSGFWLAQIPGARLMGWVMFFGVPSASGFAIALVTPEPKRNSAAAILTTIVSLGVLFAYGLESLLCVLLSFPLVIAGLYIGIALGYLFRRLMARSNNNATFTSIFLLALPFVIFAGHRVETSTLITPRREVVTSTTHLAAPPAEVWANLRSFDSVIGPKPFLMYVGLPVPVKCVMQGEGIGAKRTCYFNRGSIEEIVTDWSPPALMGLQINRTDMPGRPWLDFEGAQYELRQEGEGTLLTRTTTVTSNLYPAWYWRPFEEWGVRTEHEYIFGDLLLRSTNSGGR